MPEQTRNEKPRGLTRDGLRGLGLLLCALGALGSAVFQNGLLGLSRYTGAELLAAMQASDTVMGYATAAILLQAAGACALPIFTFLLVEGFSHTADLKRYALRLGAAAALCEVPYNLASSGKWLDLSTRSPVLALLLALAMLYLFAHFSGAGARTLLVRCAAGAAALVWALVLHIDNGAAVVVLAAVLWLLRAHAQWQVLAGCAASALAFPAPFGMLAVHFYNGEKGKAPRLACYAAYPIMLLLFGLVGTYVLK